MEDCVFLQGGYGMSSGSNYIKDLGVPCPICGKTDWCSILNYGTGDDIIVCERSAGFKKKDTVQGADGLIYIVTTFSSKRSHIPMWREYESYKAYCAQYKGQDNVNGVKHQRRVVVKREVVAEPLIADDDRLHEVYSTLLDLLTLEDFHFQHFYDDGWTMPLLKWLNGRSKIRSLPPSSGSVWFAGQEKKKKKNDNMDEKIERQLAYSKNRTLVIRELIRRVGEPLGIPGFYLKETSRGIEWELACGYGILFPIYSMEKKIVALRLKVDFPYKNNKYIWVSSWKVTYENGKAIIKYKGGTPVKSRVHVQYPEVIGDTMVINITEGEKKSIVSAFINGQITISIPGVNNLADLFTTILALVAQYGVKFVIIALDADKLVNEAVMNAESNLKVSLKIMNVEVGIASWNPAQGKGLDDCVLNGYSLQYEIAQLTAEEKKTLEQAS